MATTDWFCIAYTQPIIGRIGGSRFCRIEVKQNSQTLGRRESSFSRWQSLMIELAIHLFPVFMCLYDSNGIKRYSDSSKVGFSYTKTDKNEAPLLRVTPRLCGWGISLNSLRVIIKVGRRILRVQKNMCLLYCSSINWSNQE